MAFLLLLSTLIEPLIEASSGRRQLDCSMMQIEGSQGKTRAYRAEPGASHLARAAAWPWCSV